jgi:hypothetical protein
MLYRELRDCLKQRFDTFCEGGEPKLSSLSALANVTKFNTKWLVHGKEQERSRPDTADLAALAKPSQMLPRSVNTKIRNPHAGIGIALFANQW